MKAVVVAIFILLLTVLLLVGNKSLPKTTLGPKAAAQQPEPEIGSLRWRAQQAFANGVTSITVISDPHVGNDTSLADAINEHSVLVADVLSQSAVYYEDGDAIITWFKFHTVETLKQTSFTCSNCSTWMTPPASFFPLQSGEFLVPLIGGSVSIENVAVTVKLKRAPEIVTGQRYLLFLQLDTSLGIGRIPLAAQGVVYVESNDTLSRSWQSDPGETEPISYGLATQYGNSLAQLRAALNPSTPTPTPTPTPGGCNPSQQQECNSRGGIWYWDADSCTCKSDPCIAKPWLCE